MTEVVLRWRPSRALHTLASVALVGLVLAAALRSATALALVVPELLWLAYYGRPSLPRSAEVLLDCSARQCEEVDELTALLVAETAGARVHADPQCFGAVAEAGDAEGGEEAGEEAGDEAGDESHEAGRRSWRWTVPAGLWGRRPLCHGRLTFSSPGGLWVAHVQLTWPEVVVLPERLPLHETVQSPRVRHWAGSRPARVSGAGVEATGVMPYVQGMPIRHVNWRQTMRHRDLHVTTFAAERAQDVVVVVDATVEAGPAGDSTVDRAVRAAAALARAHIEAGDRVGVVTITPAIGWTVPGLGQRHLVRLLERLIRLRERDSVVPPDLDRIPRTAVPPGSLVVLLSPLLSEESIGIAGDLRRRGHPMLLVDVVNGEPPATGRGELVRTARRLWRLDRLATRVALEDRGIRVVPWTSGTSLEAVLATQLSGPTGAPRREVVA
jgi:uncharacterized protein (DUF58 family)